MTINEIYNRIIIDNSKVEVWSKIEEAKYDFIEDDWKTEFETVEEAYYEQGRFEAEDQILNELIIHKLSDNDYFELYDLLKDYYELG